MSTLAELRRAARAAPHDAPGPRVALAGDVATPLFAEALRGALALRGLAGPLFEADFDQVSRQILARDSALHAFRPDAILVWEAAERWWERPGETAEDRLARVRAYAAAAPCPLLVANAAPLADGVFGSFAAPGSFAVQVRRFNAGLDALAATCPNLYVADLAGLVADLGRAAACDPALYATAAMPLTPAAQAAFAERVADSLAALRGRVRKCVAVDLDDTLWGGILGEAGPEGLTIGGPGIGAAHLALQRWLLRLRRRGILLAICSKNDEPLVRQAFAARAADLALSLDDFVCLRANWRNKADNLRDIAGTLGLGLDAFVFLDDSPAERALVRRELPEVCVPELPADPAARVPFLARLNLFETASASAEDAARTARYQAEARRAAARADFTDEAGFLRALAMRATVRPLAPDTLARAAQLSQRTNQFNLRTRRYTEAELAARAADPAWVCLTFALSDRFGDNGLVSLLLAQINGADAFIDTWLMSCRVLGRGLERFALNALAAAARAKGAARLVGEYLPTPKNARVATLLPSLGFAPLPDGRLALDLHAFAPLPTFVANGER